MKLTPKKYEELYEQMAQRMDQRVREISGPRTNAFRLYPNLKRAEDVEQPNRRGPIDGWSHLTKGSKQS